MKLLNDVANSIALAEAFSICDSTYEERIVHTRNTRLKDRVNDVVDLIEVRHDQGIDLAIQSMVSITLIHLQLVELNEGLIHARLVHLKLLLLVPEKLLKVRAAISEVHVSVLQLARLVAEGLLKVRHLTVVLGEHGRKLVALAALHVVGLLLCQAKFPPELLDLILAAAARAVLVVKGAITLADHVGQLEVLGLDLTLKLLSSVDGLLCAGCLELNSLELLKEIEMLVSQLRVQLRQCLVFRPPCVDLLLKGPDLVVLAVHLLAETVLDMRQLTLQGLDSLVVLLKHQLVTLVLCPRIEVLPFKLSKASLKYAAALRTLGFDGPTRSSRTRSSHQGRHSWVPVEETAFARSPALVAQGARGRHRPRPRGLEGLEEAWGW
ncbi:hypothetical protein HG530_001910 [Fusarium avenaceum]|nr:hypothetical protein HG530_001910 [Fusarium avenaceum]